MSYPVFPIAGAFGNSNQQSAEIFKTRLGNNLVNRERKHFFRAVRSLISFSVSTTDRATTEDFLTERDGRPFTYRRDPAIAEIPAQLYFCTEWRWEWQPGLQVWTLSAQFKQVFR